MLRVPAPFSPTQLRELGGGKTFPSWPAQLVGRFRGRRTHTCVWQKAERRGSSQTLCLSPV
ncbi:rCG43998 [Rattus norvegicus]|uniref:RCG43998 n=1 Tax=Rattus norvegicus TaxID=10116 RepID=A6J6Z5_RAT|nr:rCG43998 [Rattus norvegicus]